MRPPTTKIPAMLPDGFHWKEYMGSQALYLGDQMVANYSQRPGAPYALAYFHCGAARYRGRTYGSEATARAYIEGWARRWHVRLREEYASIARQVQ